MCPFVRRVAYSPRPGCFVLCGDSVSRGGTITSTNSGLTSGPGFFKIAGTLWWIVSESAFGKTTPSNIGIRKTRCSLSAPMF